MKVEVAKSQKVESVVEGRKFLIVVSNVQVDILTYVLRYKSLQITALSYTNSMKKYAAQQTIVNSEPTSNIQRAWWP